MDIQRKTFLISGGALGLGGGMAQFLAEIGRKGSEHCHRRYQ